MKATKALLNERINELVRQVNVLQDRNERYHQALQAIVDMGMPAHPPTKEGLDHAVWLAYAALKYPG